MSLGNNHTCGIRTSGRLYCWGSDDNGQLGNGVATSDQPTPVEVTGGGTNWVAVSAGGSHTCARRSTGRLYCWGDDADGQLGDGGTNTDQPVPVQVAGGQTTWTSLGTGTSHTCARRSTGRLYCWGDDDNGQLGNGGTDTDQPAPAQVAGGHTTWTAVTAGGNHSCGRRSNGRLYCWGNDGNGQLGNGGTNTEQPAPAQVAGGHTTWTAVTAGGVHACGRRSNGRLYCWGNDGNGQLGNGGTNTEQPAPVQVAGGHTTWTAVTAGGVHACGRRSNGRLYCWGFDNERQLGDDLPESQQSSPSEVAGAATDWGLVDAGGIHTCSRTTNGRLYCWGLDNDGQLGDGVAVISQPRPSEVYVP